ARRPRNRARRSERRCRIPRRSRGRGRLPGVLRDPLSSRQSTPGGLRHTRSTRIENPDYSRAARTCRLVFMTRRGETDWNVEGRWQGHTDTPLNENGRAQARAVAEALRSEGVPAIVSSDLARAHETAQIIGASLGIAVAYVDADLRERMFGVFEGLTRAECERLHPEAWRAWIEEQRPASGVESPETVAAR